MKQVLQSLKNGGTEIAEIPCPQVKPGHILVRTSHTLVSAGTERMLVEFGKAGWVAKARQQPDKVRMVLEKIRTDGLVPTIETVMNRLDQPLPVGYCNVGTVLAIGASVTGFEVGDRVASNGKHAEVVSVPVNLAARVPSAVSDEEGAFTVLGAIALQGIRLAQPTLGETIVVTGLGLIGLVAVQLLRAHGCRVLGLDFDPQKLELARRFGAEVVDLGAGEDPVAAAQRYSRGRGIDAVLITASTKSNEPVHQAALMCRKRGRIVLVGVSGLELSRADFYEKELTFQVSCSYGPGRYDVNYEEKGQDYPVGFVRWTEQRNLEAVLDMLADGRLDPKPLVSHGFAIEQAEEAYALVAGGSPSLGILLRYPAPEQKPDAVVRRATVRLVDAPSSRVKATLGFIGAGNYAGAVLIPAFKASGAHLKVVVSSTGVSGVHAARKYGFELASTDTDAVFADPDVAALVITTRHDSHAELVCRALRAGKHVYVEKPLALRVDELQMIERAYEAAAAQSRPPVLMVGFNRRFAPHVQKLKRLLAGVRGPKAFVMTVNAGAIPASHWTQDPAVGGGRVVGEACHFIDLLRHLADAPIVGWTTTRMAGPTDDTVDVGLRFADGSIGSVHYFANGTKAFPKERLEIFAAGRVLQLDNFRSLTGFGWPGFKKMKLWRQDKGQKACAAAFMSAVERGGHSPMPLDEVLEVSRTAVEVAASVQG
jgi:predicted dehydrogenase/threonine dehydrogenase-like Zn-dependent dehydrogenase